MCAEAADVNAGVQDEDDATAFDAFDRGDGVETETETEMEAETEIETDDGIEPVTDATETEADIDAAAAAAEAIVDRDALANGYLAMSVDPAKQGEGRVSKMRAVAAAEEAERRAAVEREAAVEATRAAVRRAARERKCGERGD